MSFNVIENPVTGERAVMRISSTPHHDGLVAADICARPGAAIVGEHVHPRTTETFTAGWYNGVSVRFSGTPGPGTRSPRLLPRVPDPDHRGRRSARAAPTGHCGDC